MTEATVAVASGLAWGAAARAVTDRNRLNNKQEAMRSFMESSFLDLQAGKFGPTCPSILAHVGAIGLDVSVPTSVSGRDWSSLALSFRGCWPWDLLLYDLLAGGTIPFMRRYATS